MKLTNQDVFDKAWNHFVVNHGAPSFQKGPDEGCRYRTFKGKTEVARCAIGLCIPDELYFPELEGLSADSIVNSVPRALRQIPAANRSKLQKIGELFSENIEELDEIQGAHDVAAETTDNHEDFHKAIEAGLRSLAELEALTIPGEKS